MPVTKRTWKPEEVKALRVHARLTQAALAQELGLVEHTVWAWESDASGTRKPKLASMAKLDMLAKKVGF